MSPLVWLLMLVLLVAAGAAGFYFGRASSEQTRRAQRLEQDLERAHADLARYQEQVARHFGKTASLFNNLTGTYRSLYEHLSLGSHILGKSETPRLEGGVPRGELDEEPMEADAERLPYEPHEWATRGRQHAAEADEAAQFADEARASRVSDAASDSAPPDVKPGEEAVSQRFEYGVESATEQPGGSTPPEDAPKDAVPEEPLEPGKSPAETAASAPPVSPVDAEREGADASAHKTEKDTKS